MCAKYRLPVILCQSCLTQQSHGLFATAKLLVLVLSTSTQTETAL